MPNTQKIAAYDYVEFIEAVDNAPAGARGGVVEMLDGDPVMVGVTTLPLEPVLDRIVVAPLSKLRVVEHVGASPPD